MLTLLTAQVAAAQEEKEPATATPAVVVPVEVAPASSAPAAAAPTPVVPAAVVPAAVVPAAVVPAATVPEPKPVEHVRLDFGMAIMAWGSSGATSFWPTARGALEIHLAGPAWLITGGHVRYRRDDFVSGGLGGVAGAGSLTAAESRHIDAGGMLGVRLETPVFDWLELGGYAALQATYGDYRATGFSDSEYGGFGGQAGAGAHLRPTRFFGMRLGLELLRAGHTWQLDSMSQIESSSAYAELVAWPTFELTFTF